MRVSRDCWKCEYEDCGHIWIAAGEDAPGQCAKCKKRRWHTEGVVEVQMTAELAGHLSEGHHKLHHGAVAQLGERQATDSRDHSERSLEVAGSIPASSTRQVTAPTILPPVSRGFSPLTIPGVKLGSELAIPDEEEESALMCSYREYDTDTGETMACRKAEHSPKVKHGNWMKV